MDQCKGGLGEAFILQSTADDIQLHLSSALPVKPA
jgi:hypothetical protein